MAYCKNCGAYVPDGHTKCLACGLDQNEKKEDNSGEYHYSRAAGTATRSSEDRRGEDMRRRMEEQRRKQQEQNRKWAEAERQRRQSRQSESREKNQGWENPYRQQAARPNKLLACLSYLPFLFVLPFVFCRQDKYAVYHARQGASLFAIAAVGEVLGAAFGLSWIVTLMHIYLAYRGIRNANSGKMEPLPYIGNLFIKQD